MNVLASKFKEVIYSVLPITIIVLILNFTIASLEFAVLVRFLTGAVFVIIGLSVFLFGVDMGITPIGNRMGSVIAKSNRIWVVVAAGLVLGFFISIAEPDLHILANQVDSVTSGLISKWSIVLIVSAGIAAMLALGLARIVGNIPLYKVLIALYGIIGILSLFTTPEFLAISFDASGATTGAMTVPFILALAIGVSSMKKDSKASEKDSFGLVAIASTGAIISVMVMSLISKTDKITEAPENHDIVSSSVFGLFKQNLPKAALEIFLALLPVLIVLIVFQILSFKLSRKAFRRILMGLLFTFVGLVLFITGVNSGFMDVGSLLGSKIALLDNKAYLIVIGFILGLVTILAEPAVYVLTHQIEDVTSGYVKRRVILLTLAIGVGFSVALSMVRILVPGLQLWHYLLPGYILSLALTFFAPKLFVGIAFDSGGVASGPMTATFILAFAQGAANATESATVMVDGFGIIALVAMTPLIALQILGLLYKLKSKKGGVEKSNG
mgnify:CR=1 FL=1